MGIFNRDSNMIIQVCGVVFFYNVNCGLNFLVDVCCIIRYSEANVL